MQGLGYLIGANLLGGASYVATGWALKSFAALPLTFWRTLLTAALFLPFIRGPRLSREDFLRVALVGVFGYAVPLLIGTEGQRLSSATLASILIGVEPVSIVLLSWLFLGERLTGAKSLGLFAGVCGGALVTLQGRLPALDSLSGEIRGNLLLALHGFCWSLYTVIGAPAVRRLGAMRFTGLAMFAALPPLAVACLPGVAPRLGLGPGLDAWTVPGPSAWAAVVLLAFGVGFWGTLFWNRALELVEASRLAHFIFLQPVVGIALGLVVERKPLSAWSIAGAALIGVGIYAVAREDSPARAGGRRPPCPRSPSAA